MSEQQAISEAVLVELPFGKFLSFEVIKDMDGNKREAVKWLFNDRVKDGGGIRKSYFALDNGEYLGEAI